MPILARAESITISSKNSFESQIRFQDKFSDSKVLFEPKPASNVL